MNNNDMSNIMNKINTMMNNGEIPDDVKNMMNNFLNNNNNGHIATDNNTINQNSSKNPENPNMNLDMATIMKMKKVMDSMNLNKDDPRAELLNSLKPYLKQSRKEKVDQYIKLLSMGKVAEVFNSLGSTSEK